MPLIDPLLESKLTGPILIALSLILDTLLILAYFLVYEDNPYDFGSSEVYATGVFTFLGTLASIGSCVVWVIATAFSQDLEVRATRNTGGIILSFVFRDLPLVVIAWITIGNAGWNLGGGFLGFVVIFHTLYTLVALVVSWFAYVRLFALLLGGKTLRTIEDEKKKGIVNLRSLSRPLMGEGDDDADGEGMGDEENDEKDSRSRDWETSRRRHDDQQRLHSARRPRRGKDLDDDDWSGYDYDYYGDETQKRRGAQGREFCVDFSNSYNEDGVDGDGDGYDAVSLHSHRSRGTSQGRNSRHLMSPQQQQARTPSSLQRAASRHRSLTPVDAVGSSPHPTPVAYDHGSAIVGRYTF